MTKKYKGSLIEELDEFLQDLEYFRTEMRMFRKNIDGLQSLYDRLDAIERLVQGHSEGVQNVYNAFAKVISMTKDSILQVDKESIKVFLEKETEKLKHIYATYDKYKNTYNEFESRIEYRVDYINNKYEQIKSWIDSIAAKDESLKVLIQRANEKRLSLKDTIKEAKNVTNS